MKFTYFGQSCFLVELQGKKVLFDPFITPNALASHIDVAKLKPHFILVSHVHEDHMADLEYLAETSGALIIGIWELYEWLLKKGIKKTHPMNIGGFATFDFGMVQMITAHHSSSFPDGSYGGAAAGFVITAKEGCFYYSGDTALFSDMKLITQRHKLDFAVLPIGSNFTMDATDAAQAAEWLNVNKVIGVHYDTFDYIKINHEQAKTEFQKKGVDLLLLKIGKSIEI